MRLSTLNAVRILSMRVWLHFQRMCNTFFFRSKKMCLIQGHNFTYTPILRIFPTDRMPLFTGRRRLQRVSPVLISPRRNSLVMARPLWMFYYIALEAQTYRVNNYARRQKIGFMEKNSVQKSSPCLAMAGSFCVSTVMTNNTLL